MDKKTKKIVGITSAALVATVVSTAAFVHSAASGNNEKSRAIDAIHEARNKSESNQFLSTTNPDEVVRVIVELKADSVSDKKDISEYSSSVREEELKLLKKQADIVSSVEKITKNDAVNKSTLITNSFSIDAKRSDVKKIASVEGVSNVYEATTYKSDLATAISMCNVDDVWNTTDCGYTGDGTIIAVLDTGVNYKHQDMKLDSDASTKYTKSEWEDKIASLGYGIYLTDKVPFGYDYSKNTNDVLSSNSIHGYHVSGIISANGNLTGVAPDSQIVGLKVLDDNGYGTTDDIVKGMEDAVKLGVDVLNMSFGSDNAVVDDNDFMQSAINKASDAGLISCVAAGNAGTVTTDNGYPMSNDLLDINDTSVVGNPSVAKSCLCVASVNNSLDDSGKVYMSIFSSWGPTNELTIKPEISAPGGDIISLSNGSSRYEVLSGTSMATPYISGCSSIVLNSIKKKGFDLSGIELVNYVKAALMNTATVLIDSNAYDNENTIPYSVREQGAGMVDLYAAVNTDVIATSNNVPKIELGEIEGSKSFSIKLTNYGSKDITYTLPNSNVYTDITLEAYYALTPVEGAYVSFDTSKVTVKAGESVTVDATLTIPSDYPVDSYVEAFVNLEGEGAESLTLPLLAFYGDWSSERIIDTSSYDTETKSLTSKINPIFPSTVLTNDSYSILGTEYSNFTIISEGINDDNTISSAESLINVRKTLDTKNKRNTKLFNKDNTMILSGNKVVMEADNTYSATIEDFSDYDVFEFTPSESGYYVFYSDSDNLDTYATLRNKNAECLFFSDDNATYLNFGIEYYLEANSTYYYDVRLVSPSEGTFNVHLETTDGSFITEYSPVSDINDCTPVTEHTSLTNEITSERPYLAYSFKPEKSGYYTFGSECDDSVDPVCSLNIYDEKTNAFREIIGNDDSINSNFLIEYYLSKDVTYVYYMTIYSDAGSVTTTLQSSDGSRYEQEHTVYKTSYSGDKVAFSPNSDGYFDTVVPCPSLMRNAKELSIKVLDSDKKVIRTIASLEDVRKPAYFYKYFGETLNVVSVLNSPAVWDGTIYNKSKGKFENVDDGQYYIEISSKINTDSKAQTVTLPVKVDTVAPSASAHLHKNSNGTTSLHFTADDNIAISNKYFVYKDNTVLEKFTANTKFNNINEYDVSLGTLVDDYVLLTIYDAAGNEVIIEPEYDSDSTNDPDEPSDNPDATSEPSTNTTSPEDSPIPEESQKPDESFFTIYTDLNIDVIAIDDDTFYLSGYVADGYTLTANNVKAVVDDYNSFIIGIDTNGKTDLELNIKVTDSNDVVVYNKDYSFVIDKDDPEIALSIAPDIYEEFARCTVNSQVTDSYLLKENISYPIKVNIELSDENLDSSLNYAYAYSVLSHSYFDIELIENEDGTYSYELTKENMDEFKGMTSIYVSCADRAGRTASMWIDLYSQENEDLYRSNTSQSASSVTINDISLLNNNVITADMLNDDGTFTVIGSLSDVPALFTIDGVSATVDPETLTFTCDINVNVGISGIKAYIKDNDGKSTEIFYKTAYNEMNITLNLPKADKNGTIRTNKENFTIDGTISSYIDGYKLFINGDNIYTSVDTISTHDGNALTRDFTYALALDEGENHVEIILTDYSGYSIKKDITVKYEPEKIVVPEKKGVAKIVKNIRNFFKKLFRWF